MCNWPHFHPHLYFLLSHALLPHTPRLSFLCWTTPCSLSWKGPFLPLCSYTFERVSHPFDSPMIILSNYSFSSESHSWSAAPVQLDWTSLYTNVVYKVSHLLTFPEGTLQLTLPDNTAVHFLYRSIQWTEFVLFLYQLPYIPASNRWNRVRYINLNRHLRNLYKAPQIFQKQAAQAEDRVPPVSAPPVNGRPGWIIFS